MIKNLFYIYSEIYTDKRKKMYRNGIYINNIMIYLYWIIIFIVENKKFKYFEF